LRALDVKGADVLGYSQGGGVALQLALRHGALVDKLVMMSATFHRTGWYPSVYEAMKMPGPESFCGTAIKATFRSYTPDRPRGERRRRARDIGSDDGHGR
jgi:pimeloyl-ACP methyl ester carboxylesterase